MYICSNLELPKQDKGSCRFMLRVLTSRKKQTLRKPLGLMSLAAEFSAVQKVN